MSLRGVVALCAFIACGQDKIEVRHRDNADYNHAALVAAVDKFVAAGRTPDAYAALSQTAFALRSGMDHAVAQDTELKLIVLALAPVRSVETKPIPEQVAALGLTVWPTILAPPFEADDLVVKRDASASALMPSPGEDAHTYLLRLCGGLLASDCKQVVPERQGAVVASLVARRATERVRNALADCVLCGADPAWHEAARRWEDLDRTSNAAISDIKRQADPDNWPVAGGAAEPDARLPEAEFNELGELVIENQHYGAVERVARLRELRGGSSALALHVLPETSLAQIRALLGDASKAGAARVAVVARAPSYPWDRRMYWIADGVGTQTGLRPTDSLQLLLHAVDAVAGPGTIARVD
jgi:hypothetical protein